jgi:hypothetical protein
MSLVSTTEELLERKSSGSRLENREYGSRVPSRWPRDTLYPQKLALTSSTSGGRSVADPGHGVYSYIFKNNTSKCSSLKRDVSRYTDINFVSCSYATLQFGATAAQKQPSDHAYDLTIFTFGCCILLRIYPTGSLWRRQSQQSFNTLTSIRTSHET